MSATDWELVKSAGDESSKLRTLAIYQHEDWLDTARPEQLPPPGEWRVWYLQAGRGAGKTRAGAEWLSEQESLWPGSSWAIVAPTFADARDTCVEEHLLRILGARVLKWNRVNGEILLRSGSRIYLDGADDGALRIQGKNLRGAWCDEIGLWRMWDLAWNESLAFAVRLEPARIVATGTPKMGHGLVRQLVEDESTIVSRMRTADNVGNLPKHVVDSFYEEFQGTTRGRVELDGEWISALEGDYLKRSMWRYYEPHNGKKESMQAWVSRMPHFSWVIVSVDTPLRDKESNDFVAIQVWGAEKANRYLLDSRTDRMSYDQCKRAITEAARWARKWFRAQHRVLIENAGMGPDLIVDLKRDIGGVEKITANAMGSKGQRALAAAGDLETGNCFLPGRMAEDRSGPDMRASPASTIRFVEECAFFQLDGSHDSHDDQVDAWSQCMNWLRAKQSAGGRTWSAFGRSDRH